jgi:aconitate hydratase
MMDMGKNIFEKIVTSHLVEGRPEPGEEVSIRIDQTLTQDATGTMAFLEFEAIGIPRVKTELSVSYVDHNMLQIDYLNPDDHLYLQTAAARYGAYFSRPGNGICHQVHLERFAAPGKTLLGADSHTPTAGGVGSLAIGAGGMEIAVAMAGAPYTFKYPKIVKVELKGRLKEWISAKDVALEMLRRLTVKGGVGKAFEFVGEGIKTLSVPERATITNMMVETGATTSIFPSDEVTKAWLEAQGRGEQWKPLMPDEDAKYDEEMEIDLSDLEPLVAMPHSPDNVKSVSEVEGLEVAQVAIGSCTNSSLRDMKLVANALRGKKVPPGTSLLINPGSRQVVLNLIASGEYRYLVEAGARVLENACGPCIGMGGAPPSGSFSVRTYNRNFKGRSGTEDAGVILASPETAVATALNGKLTDPRRMGKMPEIRLPEKFIIDDSMIVPPPPPQEAEKIAIRRGPNIKPLPAFDPLPMEFEGEVLIKLSDNITTDDILPAGANVLPLRSNIERISKFIFHRIDPSFYEKAKEKGGGIIIGGENYGQGSSREHAAIVPRYLGIRAVIAKSFARIHRSNLINFGVVPLTFARGSDYDVIASGDRVKVKFGRLEGREILAELPNKGMTVPLRHDLSEREREIVLAGGLLPWIRMRFS